MTLTELQSQIALGKDSRRQFKREVTNADSLAAEMAAFANSEGGTIFLGVADDGSLPEVSRGDVALFFTDDRDGCLFTAAVRRKAVISSEEPDAGSEKSSEKILALLKDTPKLAAREIAETLGITRRAVEKQIARLRKEGRIRRIGSAKGGHWEVVE